MPPRIVNAPCSSTGSSRVKPASTSRSARSCGSISVPDANLDRGLEQALRRRHARQRARPLRRRSAARCRSPPRAARGREPPPHGSAGSSRDRDRSAATGNGSTARSTAASDAPSRAAKKKRASAVSCSTSLSVGTTSSVTPLPVRAALTAASALAGRLRPAVTGDRRSSPGGGGAAEESAKCERGSCGGHRRQVPWTSKQARPGQESGEGCNLLIVACGDCYSRPDAPDQLGRGKPRSSASGRLFRRGLDDVPADDGVGCPSPRP